MKAQSPQNIAHVQTLQKRWDRVGSVANGLAGILLAFALMLIDLTDRQMFWFLLLLFSAVGIGSYADSRARLLRDRCDYLQARAESREA